MSEHYKVSVVMSVFDKPDAVRKTINSVLDQRGVDFELIVINDGAEQSVVDVLQSFSDVRIKVFNNPNQGLTKSLIEGCNKAIYDNIARIDVDDRMLENRLRLQAQVLNEEHEVGLVTSYVETVDKNGHYLFETTDSAEVLSEAILSVSPSEIRIPIHSSVMFRKSVYLNVGGYRPEFYFAQDCDLWSRMVRECELYVIEETLTQGVYSSSGISGRFTKIQARLKQVVAEANRARNNNYVDISEDDLLMRAQTISNERHDPQQEILQQTDADYFIASILTKNRSPAAKEYWIRFLKKRPWHLIALVRFVISVINNKSYQQQD